MNDGELEAELLNHIGVLTGRHGIDSSTELIESGILDSFAILELFAFASEKFKVEFNPDDIITKNVRTVSSFADLVRQRI